MSGVVRRNISHRIPRAFAGSGGRQDIDKDTVANKDAFLGRRVSELETLFIDIFEPGHNNYVSSTQFSFLGPFWKMQSNNIIPDPLFPPEEMRGHLKCMK